MTKEGLLDKLQVLIVSLELAWDQEDLGVMKTEAQEIVDLISEFDNQLEMV